MRAVAWWLAPLTGLLLVATFTALLEAPPDAAYYAAWSRVPQWGYLDHPGAAAWPLIPCPANALPLLITWLPFFALLGSTAIVLPILRHCQVNPRLYPALFLAPIWLASGLVWTPDIPLLLAWHFALYLLLTQRALPLLIPLAIIATAAKIYGLWAVFLWLATLWTHPRGRPWALAACAAAAATYLLTGLEATAFQLQRLASPSSFVAWRLVGGPLGLILAQIAVLGLPASAIIAHGLCRRTQGRPLADATPNTAPSQQRRVLALCGGGALLPFASAAFFTPIEANWLALAHLPLFCLGATQLPQHLPRWWRPTLAVHASLLAALLILALGLVDLGRHDPLRRMRGWRAWSAHFPTQGCDLILADRYQWAATLQLYHGRPAATFDAWPPARGSAVRPSALDTLVAPAEAQTLLLVWAERPPPISLTQAWPATCRQGVVSAPAHWGAPPQSRYQVRAKDPKDCVAIP